MSIGSWQLFQRRKKTQSKGRRAQPSRRPLLEALEERTLLSTSIPLSSQQWTPIGPADISNVGASGRITGVAADPVDPNTIYITGAGGGVWKTIDAGKHWLPLTDNMPTLFMGAISIAPSNDQIIYAGTGEANNSGDSYYGYGVLVSTDAGASWTLRTGDPNGGPGPFYRKCVSQIAVDPTNPQIVYVAIADAGVNGLPGNDGIWKSMDGGMTWTNTTTTITRPQPPPPQPPDLVTSHAFTSVIMDPTNDQTIYAAIGDLFGSQYNGIYKSTDGGGTWNELQGRLPTGSLQLPGVGRISLAISQTNSPQTIYTIMQDTGAFTLGATFGTVFRFMKSTDGGLTWADLTAFCPQVLGGSNIVPYSNGQGWYDIAVAVDPTNADHVFAGGSANGGKPGMIESFDGGNTWTNIESVTHTDVHALAFDANGKLLDGNDGGIWRLDVAVPANLTWTDLNSNLQITQFTGIALNPINQNIAYGGSQDNGTEKFNDNLGWTQIDGGDGGYVRVDGGHPNTVYHTFPFGQGFFQRSDDGGQTWKVETTGISFLDASNFYPPYVIDPAESNRLLLGTDKVYESVTGGLPNPNPPWNNNGWVPLCPDPTNPVPLDPTGVVNAIAPAPSDVDTIYAADQDFAFGTSTLFGTTDHGNTWNALLTIPGIMSDVKVDPVNSQIVYVVSGSFSSDNGGQSIERTTDGGMTWQNLTGNYPGFPINSVLLDPWTKVLYIGTDAGVYASNTYNSASPTWQVLKTGFPNARVVDLELSTVQLQLNTRGYILGAGTHGRGMWELETTHFTESNGPTAPVTAGTPFQFTVNALDLFNQPIQGYTGVYTGTVHISSSDGQFAPFDYSFTTQDNDAHTFTVILKTSGPQTIMVTDTADGVDPLSFSVQIVPAATTHFLVAGPSQAPTAGAPFSITVTALDQFSNVTPGYAGTVHFSTSDTQPGVALPSDYTFVPGTDNGSHTFSGVTLDTSGAQTVTVTDTTASPTIQGGTIVVVIPAAASHLAIMAPPTMGAGNTISITVTALDPFNNVAPTYRGQVHFTTSDKGFAVILPGDYTFTSGDSGVHTFTNLVSLDTSGNQTITGTDTNNALITGFATVAVSPSFVSHLALVAPANVIANLPFTVTVQARDRFENVVPTFLDTVSFSTTDTSLLKVLPASYQFLATDSGSHTFTNGFTLITAGSQKITVSDTGVSTIKGTITLSVGNPAPVISGVTPTTVTEQNGAFTLTVNGSGFVPSSKVFWNSGTLTTTYVNGGQLQAAVPASNVTEDGQAAVTVVNPTPGGGTSTPLIYTISDAILNATVSSITGIEGAAFSGQIASFTDTNPKAPLSDFVSSPGGVLINWGDGTSSAGTVTQPGGVGTAFLVNATHTYAEERTYTTSITVTDLGGSTAPASGTATIGDAALAGSANSIKVVRNITFTGTVATFTDANPTAPQMDFTATIAWGDGSTFPGTITQPGGVGTQFVVGGTHTFGNPGNLTMTVTITDKGSQVIAPTANVQVIKRDDIVGRASQTGQIYVGASNGSSAFNTSVWGTWSPAINWVDVQSGDFNGDGRADLVGRDSQTGNWWVAISNGSSFTTSLWGAWAAAPGITWVDVKVGDFMGNGRDDIAGRLLQTGQWWLAQSTGSSFTNALWGTWNPNITWVDVNLGDFNGDHKADITGRAAAYGLWFTAISTGSSFTTSLWASWNPNVNWVDVKVGDFNGDGLSDIVGRFGATGQWFVGQSTGSGFTTSLWATWNPNATWVDVQVGDFNGDGKDDIIGRFSELGYWYVAQSTGISFNTSFWGAWNPRVSWVDVQVGDFNSDGKADMVGQLAGTGIWFAGISNGSALVTTLWATWPSNLNFVDVHTDNYVL
jgi:hypothetical protein